MFPCLPRSSGFPIPSRSGQASPQYAMNLVSARFSPCPHLLLLEHLAFDSQRILHCFFPPWLPFFVCELPSPLRLNFFVLQASFILSETELKGPPKKLQHVFLTVCIFFFISNGFLESLFFYGCFQTFSSHLKKFPCLARFLFSG